MGLFDMFKKKTGPVYTQSSAPAPMTAEEYNRHRQVEINALERRYDLSTVAGINAIPIPKVKQRPSGGIGSATGKIEYYLMLKAGQYEKAGAVDLALACYRKANALMPFSSIEYGREPYMRLPRYLRKLRRFDEARFEEAQIATLFASGLVFDYGGDDPQTALRRAEYDWLWEYLPNICPKSFSAYSRMKKEKTDKYKILVAEAKKLGYIIK